MKKKLYILFIPVLIQLWGCQKDFLNRVPLDQLSDASFWTNEKDALYGVNSCYKDFDESYNTLYADCASDNAFSQFPWDGWQVQANGKMQPTNTGYSYFTYTTIRRCNWVLENINSVPKMNEDLKKRFIGEVRFIRAYRYFLMVTHYGDVPLVTRVLELSEANQPRTPKDQVVNFIINELDTIADYLPESYSSEDVGRITKGAALSLKARMLLFYGKWKDAAAAAKEVMDLNVYSLFPDYEGLFLLENINNSEVILDVQYIIDYYSNWVVGVMPPPSQGGWSSLTPLQSLVDSYECIDGKTIDESPNYNLEKPWTNRDPRLSATVLLPGAPLGGIRYDPLGEESIDYWQKNNASKTAYSPKKYWYPLDQYNDMWNTGMNNILIRYAEVILTYAEAKIEDNSIDNTVYDAIDQVRLRAGMPAVDRTKYNTQESLRELVRRERRVELAMEGLRWYDIIRWNLAEEVLNGKVYGSREGSVDPITGEVTFSTADHIFVENRFFDPAKNYLWPIPQSEIDINPNSIQNPGY